MKNAFIVFMGLLICMVFTCESAKAADDLGPAITYQYSTNSFTLSAKVNDGALVAPAVSGSRINVIILKPGKTFDQSYTDIEMANAICYMDSRNGINATTNFTFNYTFPEALEYGRYNIKVTLTDMEKNIHRAYYVLYHTSPAMVVECVNTFKTINASELVGSVHHYTDGMGIFSLIGMEEIDLSDLGEMFVLLRDAAEIGLVGDELAEITSPDDVKTFIKVAYLLKTFDDGTDEQISQAYTKYSRIIPDVFIPEINFEKFKTLYQNFKSSWADASELIKNIRFASVLSWIQDGTNESVARAIAKYPAELGVDLAYVTANNVDLIEVAKYIDKNNIILYKDNLGEFVKTTVDKIVANRVAVKNTKISRSGGGGGGTGIAYPTNTIAPEIIEKQPEKVEEPSFIDLDGFEWSKEAVGKLAAMGILSGVGENRFEPNRAVTREEFVKMLVMAFDIKAASNVNINFVDCDISNWYYPYIGIAYANDISKGLSKYKFGIGLDINRQDAAVMCMKIIDHKKPFNGESKNKIFFDNDNIDEYARQAVLTLVDTGVISGYEDGKFEPHLGTTRAQAAVIIDRLISYLN